MEDVIMLETTKELIEEMDEIMDLFMKQAGLNEMMMKMDETDFVLMKKSLSLMNASKKLMLKQAEMIDDQTEKMNLILEKLEKIAH